MAEEVKVGLKTEGVEDVSKDIQKVDKDIKKTSKSTSELSDEFGIMDTQAGKVFKSIQAGAKAGIRSFRTLKTAIATTGIGLLVIAIASLSSYFGSTERGAQELRVAFAKIRAVADVLRDRLIGLGEKITKIPEFIESIPTRLKEAIQNMASNFTSFGDFLKKAAKAYFDFLLLNRIKGLGIAWKGLMKIFKGEAKEGFKEIARGSIMVAKGVDTSNGIVGNLLQKLKKGLKDITDEMKNESAAAGKLERRQNALNVRNREALVLDERRRNEAKEQMVIAKDQTNSLETRLKAMDKAIALETKNLNLQIKRKKEQYEIIKAQNAQGESGEDALLRQAEAAAEIERLEGEKISFYEQTASERSGLIKQHEAEQKAARDKELEDERAFQEQLSELEDENYLAKKEKEAERRAEEAESEAEREQIKLDLEEEKRLFELEQEKIRFEEDLKRKLEQEKITQEQLNKLKTQYDKKYANDVKDIEDEIQKKKEQIVKKEIEISQEKENAKIGFAIDTANTIFAISDSLFGEMKALAIVETIINTLAASMATFRKVAEKSGPVAAAFAAGLVIIQGGITVAKIQRKDKPETPKKYAMGGDISGPLHSRGGVNVNAEGGEFIVNRRAMSSSLGSFVRNANNAGNTGQSNGMNMGSLTEDRVVQIASQVVKGVPVMLTESNVTDKQREVKLRENKFSA